MNITSEQSVSISALKDGNREEISRMVEIYSPAVYRLANKMVGNDQDAEDVLQETFFKVVRSLKTFEEKSSLATWIYRITVNEALMALRKRKPDSVELENGRDDEGAIEPPVEIVDWCCMPERELMDDEAKGFLNKAIGLLSPGLRAVFLLRDVEGLSVRETSEALKVSESVVKTRLLRARLKLREDLSHYFNERMATNE
jgi:RNA polymerase sigma-70 factor (ECF subfamily)